MDILEKIKTSGLLFDGGMGSMLIDQGLKGGEAPETWNITQPDTIRDIHETYYKAGADIATTNTFGASPMKLAKMNVDMDMEAINRAGIQLAKKARGRDQYVAAEMGDPGQMLSPLGPLSVEDALTCFSDQARILAQEEPDIFIIETVFDLKLAKTAIQAIKSVTDIPIACSMTFKETPKGFFTIFGSAPEESMKALADQGASVVGANCSMGSDTMVRLASQIRSAVNLPVIIQPNAGLPQIKPDQTIFYPESLEFFTENILKIKEIGIEIVGGCCGTTPEYIQSIQEKLNAKQK
jgi:5-methyltetrahydrofolate--homocysteine methyltransferase